MLYGNGTFDDGIRRYPSRIWVWLALMKLIHETRKALYWRPDDPSLERNTVQTSLRALARHAGVSMAALRRALQFYVNSGRIAAAHSKKGTEIKLLDSDLWWTGDAKNLTKSNLSGTTQNNEPAHVSIPFFSDNSESYTKSNSGPVGTRHTNRHTSRSDKKYSGNPPNSRTKEAFSDEPISLGLAKTGTQSGTHLDLDPDFTVFADSQSLSQAQNSDSIKVNSRERFRLRAKAHTRLSQRYMDPTWPIGRKNAESKALNSLEAQYGWELLEKAAEVAKARHPEVRYMFSWLSKAMADVLPFVQQADAKKQQQAIEKKRQALAAEAEEIEEKIRAANRAAFDAAFPTDAERVTAIEGIARANPTVFALIQLPEARLEVAIGLWASANAQNGDSEADLTDGKGEGAVNE